MLHPTARASVLLASTLLLPLAASADEGGLPEGTVQVISPLAPCADSLPGAWCHDVSVECPGIPTITAEIAVTRPTAPPRGTVVAHGGRGGTFWFQNDLLEPLITEGLTVVQVRWSRDWEATPDGRLLAAACRPATLLRYVFRRIHEADRTAGFCAVGFSAGGGALGYALSHYGAGGYLDYASIAAGPPFSRLDVGCAPSSWRGADPDLCGGRLPVQPFAVPPAVIGEWTGTWTCGAADPDPADLDLWAAESIVSEGADFSFPRTPVSFYSCAASPNGTFGGAWLYSQEITSKAQVSCFAGCENEDLGEVGWATLRRELSAECVPRH